MSEIRDPIYGFITPTETEFKLINTSVFQRLRKIKQLAMTNLVYPGANHTRFEHSLGVFHLASLMAKKLFDGERDNEERRRIIRLAALLHDIGHGPFSHISEILLKKYSSISTELKESFHELITQKMIAFDEELNNLLSDDERNKIIGLLSGKQVEFSSMKNIISGPLDVDKMDYLLRDSYFCGVKYGVFDQDRIFNTLVSYDDKNDKNIAIAYDGINSLEQFILAKYYMITQVYFHKTRLISDAMIIRGIELGIDKDGIEFLSKLYNYENTDKYLKLYLDYWDDKIVNELLFSDKKGYAKDFFNRLYQRKLFKRVFSEKLKEKIIDIDDKLKDEIINIDSKEKECLRKEIEEKISMIDSLKCKKEYVIIDCYGVESVREMSRDSEGKIIIIDKSDNKKEFEEESTVFRSINESIKDVYFDVYAPLEYVDKREKERKLERIKEQILKILKEQKGG